MIYNTSQKNIWALVNREIPIDDKIIFRH